jgi:hypothetical protein
MADENTNVTNNEELDPVVNNEDPVEEEPVVNEEDNKEIAPEQKAKAAYIALRYVGATPPSL